MMNRKHWVSIPALTIFAWGCDNAITIADMPPSDASQNSVPNDDLSLESKGHAGSHPDDGAAGLEPDASSVDAYGGAWSEGSSGNAGGNAGGGNAGQAGVVGGDAGAAGSTLSPSKVVLAVEKVGEGVVSSSPSGIDCPTKQTQCTGSFEYGTVVTLRTGSRTAVFLGWSGACTGTGPCVLTMDKSTTVTATFAPKGSLMVDLQGKECGHVVAAELPIDCSGRLCSAEAQLPITVNLRAEATGLGKFLGWSEPCAGTGACTVTLASPQPRNVSLRARFGCTQISAGSQYTCARTADGLVSCWGARSEGAASPPRDKRFDSISSGVYHACGVESTTGVIRCWGHQDYASIVSPAGVVFQQVDTRYADVCGLDKDGGVHCWDRIGSSTESRMPTATIFQQISVGGAHACGIRKSDGAIECWRGGPVPFEGVAFRSVTAGRSHACAIRQSDDTALCWGDDSKGQSTPPPAEAFTDLSAGGSFTCGIRKSNNSASCWGDADMLLAEDVSNPQRIQSVSAGEDHTCAEREDGGISCWGRDDYGQSSSLQGQSFSLLLGDGSRHGPFYADLNGFLTCWGNGCWGHADAYEYEDDDGYDFLHLSSGGRHVCGVDVNERLVCWGYVDGTRSYGQTPTGIFVAVSAGNRHTCAIRKGGRMECWTYTGYGETYEDGRASPPVGELFRAVSAGAANTCGIKTDGTLSCWGDNRFGQSTPPAGLPFSDVSMGGELGCAIRQTDSTIMCWGNMSAGLETPPAGPFASVHCGGRHACALKDDGNVACWGGNIPMTPPSGVLFMAVKAAEDTTCGIDTASRLWCWGAMARQPI